jgi:hypothetical protein
VYYYTCSAPRLFIDLSREFLFLWLLLFVGPPALLALLSYDNYC